VKIAICIPCYGNPEVMFMQCLVNMINHFTTANATDTDGKPLNIEWDVFIVGSSMLTESRHRLTAEALAWGADYMLCLDADHTFPPDTLLRLWSANKPIIGCNYSRRAVPTAPTACAFEGGLLYSTEEKIKDDLVEQCQHLGFGVLLINMAVFDNLQAHAESQGEDSFLPLFMFEPSEDKVGMVGEDVYFFRKMRAAGVDAWVDHGLSGEVGHIHKTLMRNSHAVSQRDDWTKAEEAKSEKLEKAAAEAEA